METSDTARLEAFSNGVFTLALTLLAEYLRDPANNCLAMLVYSVTLAIMAVLFNIMWRYARTDDGMAEFFAFTARRGGDK